MSPAKGFQLAALAAETAHRVTGVASFILLTNIGDQHLRAPYLDFDSGESADIEFEFVVLRSD
jgi:hypothetical protein